MSKLLRYLPLYESESTTFREIMRVEDIEFEKLRLDMEDFKNQLLVDTATWGLAIYEKELGLPIEPDLNIEMRRSIIKSKKLMAPPSSRLRLVEMIKSFIETAEVKEHFGEYRFDVVLKTLDTVGEKLPYITNIVNEFKPAHLEYIFILCYLYYPKVLIKFKRYLTEKFKVCGTMKVSGEKYYSTQGRGYRTIFDYNYGSWLSSVIPVVYKNRRINSCGLTYRSGFKYNYSSWLSLVMPVVFEDRKIESLGSSYGSDFKYNYNSWFSLAIANAFADKEIAVSSYKSNFLYEEKSYLSSKLQACSKTNYVKEVRT